MVVIGYEKRHPPTLHEDPATSFMRRRAEDPKNKKTHDLFRTLPYITSHASTLEIA